jgi:hypothetical protein
MANVGRVPGDNRLPDAIGGTMATRFASVYSWPVGKFNVIVAGFTRPVTRAQLVGRLESLPPALAPARGLALRLRPMAASSDPLTDDRAPVEWMTDQMIVQYAAAGGNGK